MDASVLDLQGTLESIYAEGEQVGGADGVLDVSFVEKYKSVIVPVEIRTSIAVYQAELLIAVPYQAHPQYEVASREAKQTTLIIKQ